MRIRGISFGRGHGDVLSNSLYFTVYKVAFIIFGPVTNSEVDKPPLYIVRANWEIVTQTDLVMKSVLLKIKWNN
jgi:hypothetical protein